MIDIDKKMLKELSKEKELRFEFVKELLEKGQRQRSLIAFIRQRVKEEAEKCRSTE